MNVFWILPIAAILIFILRIRYPFARRSFQSALVFFSVALLLQFQNCSKTEVVETKSKLEEIR